jgi:hypothetical protein
MTDADLMDANCTHGLTWWECKECEREDLAMIEREARAAILASITDEGDRAAVEAVFRRVDWRRAHEGTA